MSKKRSKLDFSDYEYSDVFSMFNSATVAGVAFAVWVSGLILHICFNSYIGYKSSNISIERHQEWHDMCLREPRLREEQFEKCLTARIEKDLSVTWTTVNYVLQHTNLCVVTSCYSVFMDLVNNLGWLFLGVACVGAILFWITTRHSLQAQQLIRDQQSVRLIDLNGSRSSDRLSQIKPD